MKNFDKEFGQQVINNLYAVFLGIVLSATFNVDAKNGNIDFAMEANWIALALLIVYYLLDWFSSIFNIRNDDRIDYYHLYLFVFANIILCAAILLAIKNSCLLFLVFGIYSFAVPFWDLFLSAKMINDTKEEVGAVKSFSVIESKKRKLRFHFKFITSFRFIFGLVLVTVAIPSLLWFGGNNRDAQYVSYAALFFIVATKWARMILLFRS